MAKRLSALLAPMAEGVRDVAEMTGPEIAQLVAERLSERLEKEARALPDEQQQIYFSLGSQIIKAMVAGYSVMMVHGLYQQLDLSQPLISICTSAANLLRPKKGTDEAIAAAFLTFDSVAKILESIAADPTDEPAFAAGVKAGFKFGQADVRLTQVLTGLWGIMAEADTNAKTANLVVTNRKSGGVQRGLNLKNEAAKWKAEVLPVAIKLDQKHPEWNRQKLAQEILFMAAPEKVGLRSIEDWLRDEAEQPRGPIRSRARKQ